MRIINNGILEIVTAPKKVAKVVQDACYGARFKYGLENFYRNYSLEKESIYDSVYNEVLEELGNNYGFGITSANRDRFTIGTVTEKGFLCITQYHNYFVPCGITEAFSVLYDTATPATFYRKTEAVITAGLRSDERLLEYCRMFAQHYRKELDNDSL